MPGSRYGNPGVTALAALFRFAVTAFLAIATLASLAAGGGRMVTRPRWFGTLVRRWPYAAIATGVCAIAAAGGVLIFVPHQAGPRPRALAADCGIVTCTATIPPRATASATASPSPSPRPVRSTAAAHVTLSPTASPRTPSAKPTTAPPRPSPSPLHLAPAITVAYSLVQRWSGGLQGRFTIVNHGRTALAGWQVRAVFPGDRINSAWGSGSQISGDTLVLDPSYPPTIPAGASQSMDFTAQGNTTSPATCTLNGAACG
jgi:hypothetical protein